MSILSHLLRPADPAPGIFVYLAEEPPLRHRFLHQGVMHEVAWKARGRVLWVVYVVPLKD